MRSETCAESGSFDYCGIFRAGIRGSQGRDGCGEPMGDEAHFGIPPSLCRRIWGDLKVIVDIMEDSVFVNLIQYLQRWAECGVKVRERRKTARRSEKVRKWVIPGNAFDP